MSARRWWGSGGWIQLSLDLKSKILIFEKASIWEPHKVALLVKNLCRTSFWPMEYVENGGGFNMHNKLRVYLIKVYSLKFSEDYYISHLKKVWRNNDWNVVITVKLDTHLNKSMCNNKNILFCHMTMTLFCLYTHEL